MRSLDDVLFDIAPGLADHARVSSNRVMICCPFHEETGPSCSISQEAPVFNCFGCGESGHLSKLLRHLGMPKVSIDLTLESMGFGGAYEGKAKEAKERKAKGRVGATIDNTGIDPYRAEYVLDEDILNIYRSAPTELLAKGFAEKTLRHFEVGFDHTYGRITFPLRSRYGELVGISGRDTWGMTQAKYKIYDKELIRRTDFRVPETYTMDAVKQTLFWHGHIVLPLMTDAKNDTVILAEGFKATMWIYQAGYTPVMGLVGASLSAYHTELLCRYVRRVILFLDNNNAGWLGTHAAARRLQEKGLIVDVARYPDDRGQPDDLTKKSEVISAIKNRQPYNEWTTEHVDDPKAQQLSSLFASKPGRNRWA